jgi:hypothetical protein
VNTVHIPKQASDGASCEKTMAARSVNLNGPLASERLSCSTDGSTGGDHVVNDGHRLPVHIQILGLVDDGVSINSCFL